MLVGKLPSPKIPLAFPAGEIIIRPCNASSLTFGSFTLPPVAGLLELRKRSHEHDHSKALTPQGIGAFLLICPVALRLFSGEPPKGLP